MYAPLRQAKEWLALQGGKEDDSLAHTLKEGGPYTCVLRFRERQGANYLITLEEKNGGRTHLEYVTFSAHKLVSAKIGSVWKFKLKRNVTDKSVRLKIDANGEFYRIEKIITGEMLDLKFSKIIDARKYIIQHRLKESHAKLEGLTYVSPGNNDIQ